MTDETSRAKASSEGGQEQEPSPQATQQIVDMGSTVVKNRHGTVHCLTIVGQVEGHMVLPNNTKSTKYEHVLPLLASLEESDEVDGLVLLLNTVGGDIEAGLAIAELVAGMRLPTVTLVLGGGHSIGVPLAVCGKETFIAHTASMTIHPVRMSGTVIAAPENPCSRRNAYIFPDSDPGRLSSMQVTILCDTITTGAPADIPAWNGSRSSSVISESGRSSIEIPV